MKPGAHKPRKRFGQHFLVDQQIIAQIVEALPPRAAQAVIEIGPGEGALTDHLLANSERVTIIELDRDLVAHWRQRNVAKLHIIEADVLKVDWQQFADQTPLVVVGNLPYNISTPILFALAAQANQLQEGVFMLQKEVVNRLCALPGSKAYGRLTVMLQCFFDIAWLFDVPPQAFAPPPKVDSAVCRLLPHAQPLIDPALMPQFDAVLKAAFAQRRKTIANSLKALRTRAQITAAGVDPSARPETLSVLDFKRLAMAAH